VAPLAASFKVPVFSLYCTWLVKFLIYGCSGFGQHRVAASRESVVFAANKLLHRKNNSLALVIFR